MIAGMEADLSWELHRPGCQKNDVRISDTESSKMIEFFFDLTRELYRELCRDVIMCVMYRLQLELLYLQVPSDWDSANSPSPSYPNIDQLPVVGHKRNMAIGPPRDLKGPED